MGLFDAYQFNPQSYSGAQGGLLEMLMGLQQQPNGGIMQQPTGVPGSGPDAPTSQYAMGDTQVPLFGQPQATDMSAQSRPPQMAPQAQPQQQMAPQQPGIGERLGAAFEGFAGGGGLLPAISGAAKGFSQGNLENQTAQALVKSGIEPELAKVITRDPALLRAVLPNVMGLGKKSDDITEFEYAKKQGFQGGLEQWMQRKRGGTGEFGMTPIWGTDAQGRPAILQLKKEGGAALAPLPEGVNLSRDPIKVEGPTGTVILDPQTRQQVGFIPKDVAGAAKQKEIGEAEGQATVNLPTTIATAEQSLKTIGQLRDHPGKKNWGAFGVGAMLPDMPGTDTRGFGALVDQVKGQSFMTAFQSLKGAGAITEQEGLKAEKAQARLDRAQNEKDFDTALKDLEDVIKAGMGRARQKAGVKPGAAAPANSVDDLRSKYGLK